jgi:hypothetical protein
MMGRLLVLSEYRLVYYGGLLLLLLFLLLHSTLLHISIKLFLSFLVLSSLFTHSSIHSFDGAMSLLYLCCFLFIFSLVFFFLCCYWLFSRSHKKDLNLNIYFLGCFKCLWDFSSTCFFFNCTYCSAREWKEKRDDERRFLKIKFIPPKKVAFVNIFFLHIFFSSSFFWKDSTVNVQWWRNGLGRLTRLSDLSSLVKRI